MYPQEQIKRVEAAQKLLTDGATTIEKFESIRTLLQGMNPQIDKILGSCSNVLSKIKKMQEGDIIELSAETLPEETEEEKKRKKTLLLFIRYYKQLESEVERITKEFKNVNHGADKIKTTGKIFSLAKGPFGIITIVAIIIAGFIVFNSSNKSIPPQSIQIPNKPKIKAIEFNGKRIALTKLIVGTGQDCDSPHYHAKDHTAVKALDGTVIADPGGCGFGKIKEVKVIELEQ